MCKSIGRELVDINRKEIKTTIGRFRKAWEKHDSTRIEGTGMSYL